MSVPSERASPKHKRPIVLEPWQHEIVGAAPWPFIRGLIRTDGCTFINRTNIHQPQPYEYLSYDFCNMSKHIIDHFERACDRVGVYSRVTHSPGRAWRVRINRRTSVALMLEHVGLKE